MPLQAGRLHHNNAKQRMRMVNTSIRRFWPLLALPAMALCFWLRPLPAAPAETKPGADVAANSKPAGTGPNNGPQKAETEPTLPASAAQKSPQTSGGDAGEGPSARRPQ